MNPEEMYAESQPVVLHTNARWYPLFLASEDKGPSVCEVCLLTVLVAGVVNDYAAYQGVTLQDTPATRLRIAQYGNKILFEEAQVHFCNGLDRDHYRD